MKVYPVPGGEGLRDPRTKRRIPAEGLEVPEDNFWRRRLAHGDVTLDAPKVEAAEKVAELEEVDPETWKPEPGHNLDGTVSPAPGSLAAEEHFPDPPAVAEGAV